MNIEPGGESMEHAGPFNVEIERTLYFLGIETAVIQVAKTTGCDLEQISFEQIYAVPQDL